jgi:HSP20 family protein
MTTLQFKNGDLKDVLLPKTFTPFFESFFTDMPIVETGKFRPASDIIEKENGYELQLSLAGYRKEDISINLEGNKLTVSGSLKQDEEKQDEKYHVCEIHRGAFSRTFNLPKNANVEAAEASFQDGILTISIPKAEPQGKKIEIK